MIKQIRTSKFTKVVACYLTLMLLIEMTQPLRMYALSSGPKQPEFTSFTPISTSDMVDLASGDFNYNIPIMDVGGYPINLAYGSGITMDQEASWVGLGWNLNVGQIERQVRGLPDDFKGDEMIYDNDMRENITVGTNFNFSPSIMGNDFPFNLGLGVQYNNYEGVSFKPSAGVSYELAGGVSVGVQMSSSVAEGASVSPSIGFSSKEKGKTDNATTLGASFGVSLSSRKGLENMTLSVSANTSENGFDSKLRPAQADAGGSASGSISFNNQSYTPTKRVAYENNNQTFNATFGGEVFGVEGQVRITGYGSYQRIHPDFKHRVVGAYGYENTHLKNNLLGVLDFNREKEQTFSKNSTALPVTNYTYDIYSIDGQGVSGMFRPYRSQVGYLYNDEVTDYSKSGSIGVELGLGNLIHGGVNFLSSPSTSTTGRWKTNNYNIPLFTEKSTDKNDLLYEAVPLRMVGQLDVDPEGGIYNTAIHSNTAMRLKIGGGEFSRTLETNYLTKSPLSQTGVNYSPNPVGSKIKRTGRMRRNQDIQKITNREADSKFIFPNAAAKAHHTAGIKVLQTDGTTYVYGRTVYNKKKVEATFDVSGRNGGDVETGLITYDPNANSNGSGHSDEYSNKITTPAYAHSFLITSVLTPDYEDIDNNGPSDKDLGGYTKFAYTSAQDYQWRVPFAKNSASYNEGLKSSRKDQKGNYIYGIKELTYLKVIETKTHVAFIDLENRADAKGVIGENGEMDHNSYMKRIRTIRLYSKSELLKDSQGNVIDPTLSANVKPIKTAHFEYNYELCQGTPSNENTAPGESGKLTLKKVYFTYRSSNMGKYTPYTFDYGLLPSYDDNYNAETQEALNPAYAMKGFDIWGSYKKQNEGGLPNTEFPFVIQDEITANKSAQAWTLKTIGLPSGGKITIRTESDDYKYVQDRKAMQMFFVSGAGDDPIPNAMDNKLFETGPGFDHQKYLYVKLKDSPTSAQDLIDLNNNFKDLYLSEQTEKPLYFRFLLNMAAGKSDYVSGYFEVDGNSTVFTKNNKTYASIPMKFLDKEGGITSSSKVNPISKAGWGFGRTYLNRFVYSPTGEEDNTDFGSIVMDLLGSMAAIIEIFTGPNGMLETKGCAKTFDTNKSWIRLENPDGHKFGGGLRVKSVQLSDQWDIMNGETNDEGTPVNLYEEAYGQDYTYNLEDGSSSGVATFEPNASPENAFVEPFYGKDGNYADRIAAPKENNYVEKPFGENFFPSPKVTYSRVKVSNTDKNTTNGDKHITKHATGSVVTVHYTSHDFPTKVNYTDIDIKADNYQSPLLQMLHVRAIDHITASQGFTIETNDMNGKVRSQQVFAEGQDEPISEVKYNYNENAAGDLDNNMVTIDANGIIGTKLIGVDYDLINDFNESYSETRTLGGDGNIASFFVGLYPVFFPIIVPRDAYNETQLRTASTTKVIHHTGIMVEKIASDLGSTISTRNLAWDAGSGQVLLTETINEFQDKYYSFSYPAYWYYDGMGMSSDNVGMTGTLQLESGGVFDLLPQSQATQHISHYFKIGDELQLLDGTRLWVTEYVPSPGNPSVSRVRLMRRNGMLVSTPLPVPVFKIVRSGHRNQQLLSMASVTSMTNPIDQNNDGTVDVGGGITYTTFGYDATATLLQSKKVINASAIEYGDDWMSQCENDLPDENRRINGLGNTVNPYLYNIKGDWRAIKSYSYLAGRNNIDTDNRRKSGFFKHFKPFYKRTGQAWAVDSTNWTFASRVTMFSPYGVELENKDALNRYSSAQYGYKYTLPIAVSSNAKYQEIGFDGFEDYDEWYAVSPLKPHFSYSQALINDKVFVTNEKSHTGKNSLIVRPESRARFTRKIDGCKTLPQQRQTVKKTSKKQP